MAVVGAIAAVVGVVIEAVSAVNSNNIASDARHAARAKQAQQQTYVDKLNAMMADPSAALNDPGAKAAANATTRQMASLGYLGSGNMAAAIQQSNLGYIQSQENFLASAGGVTEPLNPLLNTAASSEAYAQQKQMQLMSNVGYGVQKAANYFNTPSQSSISNANNLAAMNGYASGYTGDSWSYGDPNTDFSAVTDMNIDIPVDTSLTGG
jgi:hypothetical protein